MGPRNHRGNDLQTPLPEVRNIGSPTLGKTTVASSWLDAPPKAAFPKETSPRHAAKSAAAPTTAENYARGPYIPCEAEHAVKTGTNGVL